MTGSQTSDLDTARVRLLIKHYSDELPPHHELYTQDYRIVERQTVAALRELLAARELLSIAREALESRFTPDERAKAKELGWTA